MAMKEYFVDKVMPGLLKGVNQGLIIATIAVVVIVCLK
jgi:hypothetical protein